MSRFEEMEDKSKRELKYWQERAARAEIALDAIRNYAQSCCFGGWRQTVYNMTFLGQK